MKMPHTPFHWIMVALAVSMLLLTLNEAHGQSTGAAAVFEGRPAMAGAQAGQGAQAGPPQGGIGLQGSDATAPNLRSRRPGDGEQMAQGQRDPPAPLAGADTDIKPGKDAIKPKNTKEIAKPKDTGLAPDQRSAAKKGTRAAKSTVRRSRTGVGEIETRSGEGG